MFVTDEPTPCKEEDAEMWFAKPGTAVSRKAKGMCHSCQVQPDCLTSALQYEQGLRHTQPGVYGGLDEKERIPFLNRNIAITPG